MIGKKTLWGVGIASFLTFVSIFSGLDKIVTRTLGWAEDTSIAQQVYDFEHTGSILNINYKEDGKVALTYHTCEAPNIPYKLYFLVNGVKKLEYGPLNPAAYGKFTTHCYTWHGIPLDLGEIDSGDEITVRYDYGSYGIVDMIIIAK